LACIISSGSCSSHAPASTPGMAGFRQPVAVPVLRQPGAVGIVWRRSLAVLQPRSRATNQLACAAIVSASVGVQCMQGACSDCRPASCGSSSARQPLVVSGCSALEFCGVGDGEGWLGNSRLQVIGNEWVINGWHQARLPHAGRWDQLWAAASQGSTVGCTDCCWA
jgi:hypothetical protein